MRRRTVQPSTHAPEPRPCKQPPCHRHRRPPRFRRPRRAAMRRLGRAGRRTAAIWCASPQRKLLDPALAEDVVHDVFEAVITGRAAFARPLGVAHLADGHPQAQDRRPGAPARRPRQPGRRRRRRRERCQPTSNARSRGPTRWPSSASACASTLAAHRRAARQAARGDRLRVLQDQPHREVCQALAHQRGEPVRAPAPRAQAAAELKARDQPAAKKASISFW